MGLGDGPDETGIGLLKCLLIIFTEQNEPNFSAATFEARLDAEAMGGFVHVLLDGVRKICVIDIVMVDDGFKPGRMDFEVDGVTSDGDALDDREQKTTEHGWVRNLEGS